MSDENEMIYVYHETKYLSLLIHLFDDITRTLMAIVIHHIYQYWNII